MVARFVRKRFCGGLRGLSGGQSAINASLYGVQAPLRRQELEAGKAWQGAKQSRVSRENLGIQAREP
jgi:hypothetical protein